MSAVEIHQPNRLIDYFIAEVVVETCEINKFGDEDDVTVVVECCFSKGERVTADNIEKVWYQHNNKRAFGIEVDREHLEVLAVECRGIVEEVVK